MTRVLKSQKRAKQIPKDNIEYFRKAHSALFRSSFHKTLRELANVRKESKQLADQLAMSGTVIFNTAQILILRFLQTLLRRVLTTTLATWEPTLCQDKRFPGKEKRQIQ